MPMRRYLFQTLFLVSAVTALPSCDKKNNDHDETEDRFTLSGAASGAQEVPAVSTSGTGTVTGTYHAEHKTLDYTVTWSNLSDTPTMMHFHGPAAAGTNAPVMLPITDFIQAPSGTKSGTASLTPAQDSALLEGKMYYNVHTPLHGGGEIRAQVAVTAD